MSIGEGLDELGIRGLIWHRYWYHGEWHADVEILVADDPYSVEVPFDLMVGGDDGAYGVFGAVAGQDVRLELGALTVEYEDLDEFLYQCDPEDPDYGPEVAEFVERLREGESGLWEEVADLPHIWPRIVVDIDRRTFEQYVENAHAIRAESDWTAEDVRRAVMALATEAPSRSHDSEGGGRPR